MNGLFNYFIIVILPIFIFAFNRNCEAQTSDELDDNYQYRNDKFEPRYEGIKSIEDQPVNSDKILILSAIAETNLPSINTIPDTMNLGLYVNKKAAMPINISNLAKRYYMDPVVTERGPDLSNIKWPTKIIRKNNIPINELYAKATFMENGQRFIYPLFFYNNLLPDVIKSYRFIVKPIKKMTIEYTIIESQLEDVIGTGYAQQINNGKEHIIDWNCRNNNIEVPQGLYIIKLEGTYFNDRGDVKKVKINYQLNHIIQIN